MFCYPRSIIEDKRDLDYLAFSNQGHKEYLIRNIQKHHKQILRSNKEELRSIFHYTQVRLVVLNVLLAGQVDHASPLQAVRLA